MTTIYAAIGRAVVHLAWRRFGAQIRAAAVVGLLLVALGAWLASRGGGEAD